MRRVGLFLALTLGAAVAVPGGAFTLGRLAGSDAAFLGGGFAVGALTILLVGRLLVRSHVVPASVIAPFAPERSSVLRMPSACLPSR